MNAEDVTYLALELNIFQKKLENWLEIKILSVFASLVGIPIGIASSGIGLKICATALGIKKYKSIIKKKKTKDRNLNFQGYNWFSY